MPARPLGIWVATGCLALVAIPAVALGALVTFISGLAPPADATPAIAGVAVGAACLAAAVGAWTRRLTASAILALAAAAPVACLLGALVSPDFVVIAIVAVIGWVGLGLLLRRPPAAQWLVGAGGVAPTP